MSLAKIVEFRNDYDNQTTTAIKLYLNQNKSDSTKFLYTQSIEEFFGTKLSFISFDMVARISPTQAKNFYDKMLQNGYERATVYRKVSCVSSLYKYLINDLVEKKEGKFKSLLSVNPLANYKVSYENNNYGTFTEDEVKSIIKAAKDEHRNDLALYYRTLVCTAIRAESVVNLNMKQLQHIDGVWHIVGTDKGKQGLKKEYDVKIENSLYEEFKAQANEDGNIFSFTRCTALNKLVGASGRKYESSYCCKIGLTQNEVKERKLVLHSFKRSSANIALNYVDNAKELATHLHHSNINTSNIYLEEHKENQKKSVTMKIDERLNSESNELEDILNKMSKQELIELIVKNKRNIDF